MDDIYVSAETTLHSLLGVSEPKAKEIRSIVGYYHGVITDPLLYVENLKTYLYHSGSSLEEQLYAVYFSGYLHGVADCVIDQNQRKECEE